MLKPGGVWVNLGPLLYHWAAAADAHVDQAEDPRYRQSVEVKAHFFSLRFWLRVQCYCARINVVSLFSSFIYLIVAKLWGVEACDKGLRVRVSVRVVAWLYVHSLRHQHDVDHLQVSLFSFSLPLFSTASLAGCWEIIPRDGFMFKMRALWCTPLPNSHWCPIFDRFAYHIFCLYFRAVQFTVRKPVVVCEDCTVKAPKQRATEPGPNQEQEK